MPFIEGPHHRVMCKTLDRVLRGEIPRLIITLPPGYTKTELAVVNFIAKGFQINPRSRFIHATFSDDLARENSDKILALIGLEDYQDLATVNIRADSGAKDRWKTVEGGGLLAKAAGGPITGFRAGYMDKGAFTGALVVDDPLKPDDAFSPAKRKTVNQRATNTFRSRLAHDGVPIVVIMQRLHAEDFAGHLLTGGTGDVWHHLDLPIVIDRQALYPPQWSHGIPVEHDLPDGPLWPDKHNEAEIEILRADPYTFASQYAQRPTSVEGALLDIEAFGEWVKLPHFEYTAIYADTAQKTGERNDFSVFEHWGKSREGIYLIDLVRGKWTGPQLEATARAFWAKQLDAGFRPRVLKVEDKSSGTGLIQSLKFPDADGNPALPVAGIPRDKDKYTRGLDAAPWVSTGVVHLPKQAPYLVALKAEIEAFDGLGSGHDDQVDPLMDAISDMLSGGGKTNMVFSASYSSLTCTPFAIPPHWPRAYAVERRGASLAAIWGAVDPSTSEVYLYAESVMEGKPLTMQAASIKARGEWMPGLFPAESEGRTLKEGKGVLRELKSVGLNIQNAKVDTEAALSRANEDVSTGQVHVFSTMQNFEREYRTYMRDENGKPAETGPLMSCFRTWVIAGRRVAAVKSSGGSLTPRVKAADGHAGY